jgi:hypothetical protein
VNINFFLAALSESYFNNTNLMDNIRLTREAKGFLKEFIQQRVNESPLFSEMPFYYKKVLEMMEGAKRSIPCPYQDQGVVLDATGDLHYCTNSRTIGNVHKRLTSSIYYDPENLTYRCRVIRDVCPTCEISCFVGVGLRKTVFPFLGFIVKESLRRAVGLITKHYLGSQTKPVK